MSMRQREAWRSVNEFINTKEWKVEFISTFKKTHKNLWLHKLTSYNLEMNRTFFSEILNYLKDYIHLVSLRLCETDGLLVQYENVSLTFSNDCRCVCWKVVQPLRSIILSTKIVLAIWDCLWSSNCLTEMKRWYRHEM